MTAAAIAAILAAAAWCIYRVGYLAGHEDGAEAAMRIIYPDEEQDRVQ